MRSLNLENHNLSSPKYDESCTQMVGESTNFAYNIPQGIGVVTKISGIFQMDFSSKERNEFQILYDFP
jgi:hypothetical protein